MKVLHLIDHLGAGGAQTQLVDFLEARDSAIDPEVIALTPRVLPSLVERLEAVGVPWRALALGRRDPRGFARLREQIRDLGPDLLHTRLDVSNTVGVAAAASLGAARPLVVRTFDIDPVQHYGPVARFVITRLAPRVDAEIAVSASVGRSMARSFGERMRRIEVVPPGLDLERFDRSRADVARRAVLRSGATRVIGTVARLAEQKNLSVLLDALPALRAEMPGLRLLVAGDGPLRCRLERQAARLGVSEWVSFLGHQEDVVSVYAAMDVFVLPSRHEGFGVAFLEAMSMGVPAVGTRVVGSVDAVRDGETGLLVPPGDARALAGAILRLLADDGLARRLTGNAAEWVRDRGSRTTMAADVERLYRDLRSAPAGR
ncbi:MAG: glycosyltransferase [Gemmatimonadota bacterium]